MKCIRRFLAILLLPLKKDEVEEEIDQFLGGFRRLSQLQIYRFLEIINQEAAKSRSMGFTIQDKLLIQEKMAALFILSDVMGGVISIKGGGLEKAQKFFAENLQAGIGAEWAYDDNQPQQVGSDRRLLAHQHVLSVADSIMKAIFNEEL